MRLSVSRLQIERALEVGTYPAGDSLRKSLEDRESLTVSPQGQRQGVMPIGIVGKRADRLLTPFYRLVQKLQLVMAAPLGIEAVDRRGLVGYCCTERTQIAARIDRSLEIAAVKLLP